MGSARDWLIVPQPTGGARLGAFWKDLVSALPDATTDDVRVVDAVDLGPLTTESEARDPEPGPVLQDRDAAGALWERERRARLEAAAYRPFVPQAVTRLAQAVAPPGVTREGERAARGFGSLVHRLLEWAPVGSGAGEELLTQARHLAPRLGVRPVEAERAVAQVRGVLAHALWARVGRAPHSREVRVWLPEEGLLLEGIVDLVIDEPDGLVVVDYKTDAIEDERAIDQAAHHAPQLRLYARALGLAWKRPVKERLVFFTALGRVVPV